MKVKLLKDKGYFRLVCDEQEINEKYSCANDPICLANLSTWEGSKCWKIRDMRLEDVFLPSPHLEGNNRQEYLPVDQADAASLKSKLHYYKESPDGLIKWGTFVGVVGMGDRTDHPDNPAWIAQSVEGCWSYPAARAKFKEIRDFWENFEGDDLKLAMQPNPHKQIREWKYRMDKGDDSPTKTMKRSGK